MDPSNPKNFADAARENTKVFFAESLGNPKLDVLDLKAISAEAKAHKVPFIVDNTVATPSLLKPIEYGADIVIESLTKYINGNGTALGGAIIDAGKFNWANGKFPEFTEPSPGYHGIIYHEALLKKLPLLLKYELKAFVIMVQPSALLMLFRSSRGWKHWR